MPDADEPARAWQERVQLLLDPPPTRSPLDVGAVLSRWPGGATVAVLALLGAAVAVLLLARPQPPPPELTIPQAAPAPSAPATTAPPAPGEVVVHAAGAVIRPGVYRVSAGARVAEVLDVAGGPAPDAALDRLNLAAPLTDGQQVYVPRVGEVPPPGPASPEPGGGAAAGGPLDLNAATAAELEALPGVGPAIARAIVEERERRGRFRSVDELLEVRGIGEVRLAALRDLVTV